MRTDRDRQAEALDDFDRLPDDCEGGSVGVLLVTKTCAVYPTSAGQVYCCNPVAVDADNIEGATPTFTADTNVLIYAVNLGSSIPPTGTYVVGAAVGGRMAFTYNGP